jgi:triosephosphate isomerase
LEGRCLRRSPLIAGNWKMNGLAASLAEAKAVAAGQGRDAGAGGDLPAVDPDPPDEPRAGRDSRAGGRPGPHWDDAGAFTGDVSSAMLADAGARLVILGHSERRAGYRETDDLVAAKAQAALRAGLEPIVCVGETSTSARPARRWRW